MMQQAIQYLCLGATCTFNPRSLRYRDRIVRWYPRCFVGSLFWLAGDPPLTLPKRQRSRSPLRSILLSPRIRSGKSGWCRCVREGGGG